MSATVESGGRRKRLEFVREPFGLDYNTLPSDPNFQGYSTTILNSEIPASATLEARRGQGDVDPTDHLRGPESAEVTIAYELEQYYTDGNGNAQDAAYDGMARTVDNMLPAAHTVVEREEKDQIRAENTVSGNTARPTRTYAVGMHGKIGEVTKTGDPSDSQAITIELAYTFSKVRPYQIDQPLDSEAPVYLAVYSTDAGDTDVSVTIESEGAATTETVTTDSSDGTTLVSSSNTFEDIDAIHVPDDHAGDIIVSINTGDPTAISEGDQLSEIYGSAQYGDVEPDRGIPPLGSNGSRADYANLGTPETFVGDRLLRATDPIAYEVNSAELTVENNLETTERASGLGMHVSSGDRNTSLSATVFGEVESASALSEHLRGVQRDIEWEMTNGTLTLPNAVLLEPGGISREVGQAVATTDNGFASQGLTF